MRWLGKTIVEILIMHPDHDTHLDRDMHPDHDTRRLAAAAPRRGMLLLLVLSVLTLFLMMGTLAIVMATRARETAIAYANVTGGGGNRAVLARQLTDEALMILIRGTKEVEVEPLLGSDNLLEDMYGTEGKGPFVDEPYDAFDADNPFLTQVTLDADGLVTAVPRPAFAVGANAAIPASVDNDGDGVADGIWLPAAVPTAAGHDRFFPSLSTADGGSLEFRVSYLVLDLDGRINVNAHGRPSGDTKAGDEPAGPADVDPALIVGGTPAELLLSSDDRDLPDDGWDDDRWLASVALQRRRPPDLPSQPADGRFAGSGITRTYDLRLDLEAPRPSALSGAVTQSPFTLGELERVLRQFDPDASTLPPRLAAMLGDRGERCRMQVTTDSWETPGDRILLELDLDNSGNPLAQEAHTKMVAEVTRRVPGVPVAALRQWIANVIDFMDPDNANTNFGAGLKGAEPNKDGLDRIPAPGFWNQAFLLSYAQLLGVPKGTPAEVEDAVSVMPPAPPIPLVSLARQYPGILEAFIGPSPFTSTVTADPLREPGRVNVNTCDESVWKAVIGQNIPNPFSTAAPAKNVGDMLMKEGLVFMPPTPEITDPFDVRLINHDVANRIANVATVRSHVFAVWITLEISDSSANADPPSSHRLFAIVDRSIPIAEYQKGENLDSRGIIRLWRFLN